MSTRPTEGHHEPTPLSRQHAARLGFDPGTPACIIADKLQASRRGAEADEVRNSETAAEIAAMRVVAVVRYSRRQFYTLDERYDSETGELDS